MNTKERASAGLAALAPKNVSAARQSRLWLGLGSIVRVDLHTDTFAELVRSVADGVGTRPWLVSLPFVLWEAVALLSEFAPGTPLTRNQVALMRRDNVAARDLPGLRDLHIAPTALEDVVAIIADAGRATGR